MPDIALIPEAAARHAAVLVEARRHHAVVCRDHDPHATQDQVDRFWATLGADGQDGYLRTAEQRLAEEASR